MTDHLSLSVSHPLLKTTLSLFGKKTTKKPQTFQKLSQKPKKKGLRLEKRVLEREGLMALLKDFSFWRAWFYSQLAPVYVSEEENVEMKTWMYMQDVSYQLPIVCPEFHSLVLCKDEWRHEAERGLEGPRGTGSLESVTNLFLFPSKTETEENLLVTDGNEVGSCSQLKSNEKSMSSSKMLRSNFCFRNVSTTKYLTCTWSGKVDSNFQKQPGSL